MAPPNSLSKPLLQSSTSMPSIWWLLLVSKTLPLLILPRNLISSCTKKRSNRLVSSWPLLDTFIWLQYHESIIHYVHGTTLWGFCSPTGSSLHLVAYNDVNYAGCSDIRCSTMI